MKIRKRIKRMLVAFFKDELLEWVRNEEEQLQMIQVTENLKLYVLEHDIDLTLVNQYDNQYYHQIIVDIEKKFVDSILKLTKIEMIDQGYRGLQGITKVRFSLHLASPKKDN